MCDECKRYVTDIFGCLNEVLFYLNILISCYLFKLNITNNYVRDNVLSRGHYPKINPDGANSTPTRSGGVLFRPEGIYFWIMTDGQYIIPLIIRLLAKNYRRHSSKIPLFNDLVAVS